MHTQFLQSYTLPWRQLKGSLQAPDVSHVSLHDVSVQFGGASGQHRHRGGFCWICVQYHHEIGEETVIHSSARATSVTVSDERTIRNAPIETMQPPNDANVILP